MSHDRTAAAGAHQRKGSRMNGRQESAITHLRLVGRDVHRYASYALEYGVSAEQAKQAIADGIAAAEREEAGGGERRQVVRAI